ncbi:hypothetical protein [Actinomadura kijaniata]|uniref:hypothetical protein n=1 Tax=Actinomadura kijaniata TaxID=46161 RepID=UPI000831A6F6|nr:hypothetical protein [Actinomadura kijaniata]
MPSTIKASSPLLDSIAVTSVLQNLLHDTVLDKGFDDELATRLDRPDWQHDQPVITDAELCGSGVELVIRGRRIRLSLTDLGPHNPRR